VTVLCRPTVVTVLTDHVWIRERMARLAAGELDLAGVHGLGQRLAAHVRHKERVLFPLIESPSNPDALALLGRRLSAAAGA
jgi:hypothetical protein